VTNPAESKVIKVEELGGFVGYGGAAHVRTQGEVNLDLIKPAERSEVEQLLKRRHAAQTTPGPRYRLSWHEGGRSCEIEVSREELTPTLLASLKTDLI